MTNSAATTSSPSPTRKRLRPTRRERRSGLSLGDPACAGVGIGNSAAGIHLTHDHGGLGTLAYGKTASAGTLTCDSETTGMTCTDSSTGHFFRVSWESYQLG